MSNQPNKRNKWIALINIPIQMGIVIFLFSYLGIWLDEKFSNKDEINVKILTLVGVFVALFSVIRQVKQLNDD